MNTMMNLICFYKSFNQEMIFSKSIILVGDSPIVALIKIYQNTQDKQMILWENTFLSRQRKIKEFGKVKSLKYLMKKNEI
jgi:hypothetical protein